MTHEEAWRRFLGQRGPRVREGLERLNPCVPDPGRWIRGWFPSRRRDQPWNMNVLPTSRVMHELGRDGFEQMKRQITPVRRGKRHYWPAIALLAFRHQQKSTNA